MVLSKNPFQWKELVDKHENMCAKRQENDTTTHNSQIILPDFITCLTKSRVATLAPIEITW